MGSPAKNLAELGLAGDTPVTGLCADSRTCKPGNIFAALGGANGHGAAFVSDALQRGAAAVLTDAEGAEVVARSGEVLPVPLPVPLIVRTDPRRALAIASARFFGSQPATIAAITGTNGKTSVAHFTRQIWERIGFAAVNVGTTGVEGAYAAALRHTTPGPIALHRLLRTLSGAGITHASLEASSHGLDQRRLDGVYLTAAAFTNVTRDHLDYHKTFDAYFEAKAGLFTRVLPPEGSAVINIDNARGPELVRRAKARGQAVITLGTGQGDMNISAVRAADAAGQEVRFIWNGSANTMRLNLICGFQAVNVLTAAVLAISCGARPEAAFAVLPDMTGARGRMQLAATRTNGAVVLVDYAHTPDALRTALRTLRPHVSGRIVVVLGAGGARDPGKRPLMGHAAAEEADMVLVTDDNPRFEDPGRIRRAILEGCPGATEIGDRARAILAGVDALQPGDALLIAGKGHETGQIIGGDVLPFDDVEQASIAVRVLDGPGT
ncbi:MAG: UDP-N-acetylmuramoyl-L-alanyl-D-glutamate--2,6-diaminopimelate ligase [Rhodobacteraceae bacterium]|nr:UDP-N-acetylmuramoyl-L-alanyl-D-glutamate--2,6-diaminopimelate ligase [Paracoccaceae bacterium]